MIIYTDIFLDGHLSISLIHCISGAGAQVLAMGDWRTACEEMAWWPCAGYSQFQTEPIAPQQGTTELNSQADGASDKMHLRASRKSCIGSDEWGKMYEK